MHQPPSERRRYSTRVRPADALALLERLDPVTRALLARVVGIHLVVEDVPPISFEPSLALIAQPLIAAELVIPEDERAQHTFDREWGPIPPGLRAVGLDSRLIGLVMAVLSGRTADAGRYYGLMLANDPGVRIFRPRDGAF